MQNVDWKAVLTGVRPGGCAQPYLAGALDWISCLDDLSPWRKGLHDQSL